jgi:hypothetical protein
MSIIQGSGAYVPLKVLNADTVYVQQTVTPDIYFEVIAENGTTKIVYQLQPSTGENDAFLFSTFYSVSEKNRIVEYIPRGTTVSAFFSNVTVSLGATAKIVDNKGNERTVGGIYDDDKVIVTSANGLVEKVYYISLQAPEFGSVTYLAYVLSNVYAVDQVNYVISGPSGSTTLNDFYANISPSMGAAVVVVDAGGNEKTSGDLDDGDMLKVTSADGALVVMYDLMLDLTSNELFETNQIEVYPNPASDKLNIRGLEPGYRVQLISSTGRVLSDVKANSSTETLALDDLPAGLFLVVVSNKDKMVATFKAIRK